MARLLFRSHCKATTRMLHMHSAPVLQLLHPRCYATANLLHMHGAMRASNTGSSVTQG